MSIDSDKQRYSKHISAQPPAEPVKDGLQRAHATDYVHGKLHHDGTCICYGMGLKAATPPTDTRGSEEPTCEVCGGRMVIAEPGRRSLWVCASAPKTHIHKWLPDPVPTRPDIDVIARVCEKVVQRVCELPDRTSPEEWPEAMIVTPEELTYIMTEEIERHFPAQEGR